MKSIACPLQNHARHFPHHPFLIDQKQILTYREVHNRVCCATDYLKHLGIKPKDRVAVASQNCAEYLIMLFALWRLKAVTCLLSTRLPKEALKKQIKQLGCRRVLTLRHPEGALATEGSPKRSFVPRGTQDDDRFTYFLNQPATIMFTSGSSGEPKAAVHTFGNHYFSAKGSNEHIPFKKGDRWLLSLPLYHIGGLSIVFRTLLGGGAIVIDNPQQDLASNIQRHNITHISFVSTQLFRLLKKAGNINPLKKIKAILLGGSPIPESLLKQAAKLNLPIYTSYGLTEMSSQVATSPKLKFDKVKVLKYRKLKISETGEILLRGETLFKGYWKDNRLHLSTDKEGWFHTGDLGRLTNRKFLTVTGRKDNMFISGGENIQPEEIEQHLNQMAGIEQAVVVPIRNEEFGARPIAFIKKSPGSLVTKQKISKHLSNFLPKFRIPDRFLAWPDIPKNQGLKTRRAILAQILQTRPSHLKTIR